jgi:PmbA protein
MSAIRDASDQELVARALEQARAAGAAQADAVLVRSDSREVKVRGDQIEHVKQAGERCLGIRTLVAHEGGFSSAVTSTCDLAPEAIDRMAGETVALARAMAADPHAGLPEAGFAEDIPDLDLVDPGDRNATVEARIEDARSAEAAARATDPRIDNSEGSQTGSDFSEIIYRNSEGFKGSYTSAYHSLFSEPLATDGEGKQRDYWMTVGRRIADLEDPAAVGRKAAQRALRRLGAHSIYRESSFLSASLGEIIASSPITVIDDGRVPGGLGSKPFDGEGLPTRRNVLVDGGRLESWLLDTYSGRKLGMPSTGNASRGAGSGPGVGATNLWIEPGSGTLEEIIAETERGLLVTELIGMGFNPTTGDYSRGASGLWIEAGRISHPVEEITIAGNLREMFLNIDAVGSELVWRGRVAAPPLRVARMTVAGH